MLDWLIIVFVFFVSSVSWGLFVFLSWARKWPKVDVVLSDMDVKKYKIQGKIYYRPTAKYSYRWSGEEYLSSVLFLMGGRSYRDRKSAEIVLGFGSAHVCPIFPRFSYVYQDKRAYWGFFLLGVIGLSFCGFFYSWIV